MTFSDFKWDFWKIISENFQHLLFYIFAVKWWQHEFRKEGVVFEILSLELSETLQSFTFCCYVNRNKDSSKSHHRILGLPLNYFKKVFSKQVGDVFLRSKNFKNICWVRPFWQLITSNVIYNVNNPSEFSFNILLSSCSLRKYMVVHTLVLYFMR